MSLDVTLLGETTTVECVCPHCEHAHTRPSTEVFYDANITHNLNKMADAAGVYQACWRPEEIGVTHAKQLIPLLRAGLEKLTDDPARFKQFNPENGWCTYDGLVSFVRQYLAACEDHPNAAVSVSR